MTSRKLTLLLCLLLTLGALGFSGPSFAQSACDHVIFALDDTAVQLNQTAICIAAEPWDEAGYRTFILLTDFEPETESEWFAYLDEAEIDAGLRDPAQTDLFDRDVLALEASTAVSDIAASITLGEALFDSPLDDDQAFDQVTRTLRRGIDAGQPTEGFTDALTLAHTLYQPPRPAATAVSDDAPASEPEPAAAPDSAGLAGTVGALVGLGALGGGGYLLYQQTAKWNRKRAYRQRMQTHLDVLQSRVANLLNALYQLLNGDRPDDAVLYQLFAVYGGEQNEALRDQVREWIRRSQEALDDAFDLRQKLQDPDVQARRDLDRRVRDWEMVYLTLVGSAPRIHNLTDPELHDLLNPMLVVRPEGAEAAQLARQLDSIRREIEGQPLKVDLMLVDPAKTDAQGILGYVDQAKAVVADLQEAQDAAPGWLADAKKSRLEVQEDLPADPFGMTRTQLFGAIDRLIDQAEAEQADGRFLYTVDRSMAALEALDVVRHFAQAMADHAARETAVAAIVGQGFHPPTLAADQTEIQTDITQIREQIEAGQFVAAAQWVAELDSDSRRALSGAEGWRALHADNESRLERLRADLTRVASLAADEAAPAWGQLRTYPPPNWQDVTAGLERPSRTLQRLRDETLDAVAGLNGLAAQRFDEAEQAMVKAEAALAEAERELQAIVNRLVEVRAAEDNIDDLLQGAETAVTEATAFRDAEDPKISPDIDAQLVEAESRLAEGRDQATRLAFIPAVEAATAARRLAGDALSQATEQVKEIDALRQKLVAREAEVAEALSAVVRDAGELTPPMQTAATQQLLSRLADTQSEARRLGAGLASREDRRLAETLSAALAALAVAGTTAVEARRQIAEARQSYQQARQETERAIGRAEEEVERAERIVSDRWAGSAGQHALERAKRALPPRGALDGATREALARTRQSADEAAEAARQARQLAERAIREARWRQTRQSRPWIWGFPGSGGSWTGGGRSSGGWSGTRSRSGGRSTSRRSSSMGGARRSSSFGGSRRSSSRGGSRRG